MSRNLPWALLGVLLVAGLLVADEKKTPPADEKKAPPAEGFGDPTKVTDGTPALVEVNQREDLGAPTSVVVSPDGKFLYASAWKSASHVVFKRDAGTGKLTHVQTVQDATLLDGATDLRLSRDGTLAAAAAFRSQSVVLYRRDLASGKLTQIDSKRQTDPGMDGLSFAIGAEFAPDGRFLYVLDSNGGVTAFKVTGKGDKRGLEFVEANQNADLKGIRGLAFHPSGDTMYAACYQAHTLVVLDRDAKTGKTNVRQVMRDGQGGVEGLEGAFGVAVSPEGKFVYSVSGRFGGDEAVGAWKVDAKDRTLTRAQETIRGGGPKDPLADFEGGNEITVSPDGRNVYAVATRSGALATFARDTQSGLLKLIDVTKRDAVAGGAGVTVSPDWRHVYVAAEEHSAVTAFRRK